MVFHSGLPFPPTAHRAQFLYILADAWYFLHLPHGTLTSVRWYQCDVFINKTKQLKPLANAGFG